MWSSIGDQEWNGRGGRMRKERRWVYWTEPPPTSGWNYFISLALLQILQGNANTYSENENLLQPIVFATKIRIYPYNQYERTVCLRVEVVGCPTDGEYRSSTAKFRWMLHVGLLLLLVQETMPCSRSISGWEVRREYVIIAHTRDVTLRMTNGRQ